MSTLCKTIIRGHSRLEFRSSWKQISFREYALSRFPERASGTSRVRRRPTQNLPIEISREQALKGTNLEPKPSIDDSQLWRASQRPTTSDPGVGLQRLLMEHQSLVITREIEMLNVFAGFEQSNRYSINNEAGECLGYLAEEPRGFLSAFSRQILRTHRPFRALVMDQEGTPVLWLRRPFAWINSRMFVQKLSRSNDHNAQGEPLLETFAEVQQRWHLWKRRYDIFLREEPGGILSTPSDPQPEPQTDLFTQFARIDEGLWAWHFKLLDSTGTEIATVSRKFRGFGREIFTDTGRYVVSFVPSSPNHDDSYHREPPVTTELTLEHRALVLAMSINIDVDYFSRHSEGHGMGLGLGGWWGSD